MSEDVEFRIGEVAIGISVDRVAVVTIDAPERRNALTPSLVSEIVAAFDALESREDVGAVVVTGAGPAFCAGADLGELDSANETVLRAIYESFLRVRASRLPTVAAVGGPAVGAGLNLAMACDLRVAGRSAIFDSRFAKIGLHPGGGASWLLRAVGGQDVATAMLLFDERIDGPTAERVGLVWRCVEDADLIASATALAARAARVPAELSTRIKMTLEDTRSLSHTESVELELDRQIWSTTQPWFKQRRAAQNPNALSHNAQPTG